MLLPRLIVVACGLMAACGVRRAPPDAQAPPCLTAEPASRVSWHLRTRADERSALDAWCWAIGPAEVRNRAAPHDRAIDRLAVVVWNAHVGYGDLRGLLRDLRAGALTDAPVHDFIVLLQEVQRTGAGVPTEAPNWAAAAARIGGQDGEPREDILDVAAEHGLSLAYAPSMRNGGVDEPGPAEDRGNAILSTLPLDDLAFLELPYERQRRVAVLASIGGRTSAGAPWQLRLASVHLDNRAPLTRLSRSLGATQERQAAALAAALADGGPTVVGGDLNTWAEGRDAAAARLLHTAFPLPRVLPREPTAILPGPLPDLALDHLFFRLPADWDGGYRVVDDTYDSDHRPLVGWIRIGDGSTP